MDVQHIPAGEKSTVVRGRRVTETRREKNKQDEKRVKRFNLIKLQLQTKLKSLNQSNVSEYQISSVLLEASSQRKQPRKSHKVHLSPGVSLEVLALKVGVDKSSIDAVDDEAESKGD